MFSTDFGIGTLISNVSEMYGTGHMRYMENLERRNEQAEFDRQRIAPDMVAKVEAAKAAGIHPLVAFGSAPATGSPILSSTPPPPQFQFQSSKGEDPNIARYNRSRADLAEIEVDKARLDLAASQARLASQPGNQGGAVDTGAYVVKPSEITSVARGVPYRTAGPPGAFETPFTFRNPVTEKGQAGNLPSKDVSEPMEALGEFWKAILGTPTAGKFVWDSMFPDEWKGKLFDVLEAVKRHLDLVDSTGNTETMRLPSRSTGFWDSLVKPDSRRRSQGRIFPK